MAVLSSLLANPERPPELAALAGLPDGQAEGGSGGGSGGGDAGWSVVGGGGGSVGGSAGAPAPLVALAFALAGNGEPAALGWEAWRAVALCGAALPRGFGVREWVSV